MNAPAVPLEVETTRLGLAIFLGVVLPVCASPLICLCVSRAMMMSRAFNAGDRLD